ncbi:MAG: hypothetical protein F6K48_10575 [Okeania sp. SIO3H1]|uniref:hypothetical protein n=1 Tax=Okeania sp. SIO1I7 TaxID=2607772 RepID=UPI0013C59504|nr:hypothetical protein [Okeania sp. SIO1I7]NEN89311.1 hypothetical protein [Okeania sp. SIO3H1]NET24108.1 hypothetical protein [Okeania sp. SIO1I7]
MAEVNFGQGFELYDGMEEIRAVEQMLIWQGFGLFFYVAYCGAVVGNAALVI